MRLRKWDLLDTRDGEAFSRVSRHFSRRGADRWRRFWVPLLRYRDGYALRVARFDEPVPLVRDRKIKGRS